MNYPTSTTKKYLIMQYPKNKESGSCFTAPPFLISEPIQGGDAFGNLSERVKLILARRSQVCDNDSTNNNSFLVDLALHQEGMTPNCTRGSTMSIHVFREREPVFIDYKVFDFGLSPVEFTVYCHLVYIAEKHHHCKSFVIASRCQITEEELECAYDALEEKGLITIGDNSIAIKELPDIKPYTVTAFTQRESFTLDNKRYKQLPLRLSCVYLIKSDATGFVKIGMTQFPRKRIKSIAWKHRSDMQILCLLECSDPKHVESVLHFTFKDKKVEVKKECEWFNLTDADIELIKIKVGGVVNV